jgi:AcrR family transcriptional regulator
MENGKENILETVYKLYLKFGIKSITMDEVAREMGISKKTLYLHFVDKADLVEQTLSNTFQRHINNIDQIQKSELNAIDELFAINQYLAEVIEKEHNPAVDFDLAKYYSKIFRDFHHHRRENTYRSLLKNLQKGIQEGLYRKNMKPEIIAQVHMARMEMQLADQDLNMHKHMQSEMFTEIFRYHIYGICSRAGIDYYEHKVNEMLENGISWPEPKT